VCVFAGPIEVGGSFFAPFYAEEDHFDKTGSGQTKVKLKKRCVLQVDGNWTVVLRGSASTVTTPVNLSDPV
jgi:hypothetical protein